MSDKLRCEIVQDLLPSYVDGLTSDETNEAVKDHLADCVSCRDMYERMKADEMSAEENSEVMEKEKKEIKEKSEYMKTDQYIEDTAREKFGLVYGNEIIFKAADGESGN